MTAETATANSLRAARQARVAVAMAEANKKTGLFKARAGSNGEVLVTSPDGAIRNGGKIEVRDD